MEPKEVLILRRRARRGYCLIMKEPTEEETKAFVAFAESSRRLNEDENWPYNRMEEDCSRWLNLKREREAVNVQA